MLSPNGWRLVGKSDEHRPRNRESTFATETAPVVTGEKDLAASSKQVGGDATSADRNGHNLVLEAARAALGAYRPSFLPGLASWSPVQAGQVGSSSTSGPGEGTPWTFRGGVFTASLDVEGGTAVAHVGESLIGGDRTLVVAVRGSDDFADVVNGWGPQVQSEYWPAFRPLVNGLVTHAERSGLDRILFTGHRRFCVHDLHAEPRGFGP